MNRPHAMAPFIGHRGVAGEAPENTLEGVKKAASAGFEWIEIDVLLSADLVPVVSHDESLERNHGVALQIGQTGFEGLRAKAPALPRLDELLPLAMECGLGVNVELKRCEGFLAGGMWGIRKAVSAHPGGRIVVSSFSARLLDAYRTLEPEARLGLVTHRLYPGWRADAERLGAGNIHLGRDSALKKGSCAAVKEAGLGLYVFTVNDVGEYQMLRGFGADGVFTDVGSLLRETG